MSLESVCVCMCMSVYVYTWLGLCILLCEFVCWYVNMPVFFYLLRSPPSEQLRITPAGSPGCRVSMLRGSS